MKTLEFLKAWLSMSMGNKGAFSGVPEFLHPRTIVYLAFGFILLGALLFTGDSKTGIGLFAFNLNATLYPYNTALANNSGLLIVVGLALVVILAIYEKYVK